MEQFIELRYEVKHIDTCLIEHVGFSVDEIRDLKTLMHDQHHRYSIEE